MQQVGDRIRVTAQLIDARTDAHLWAQTYDRVASDIFVIQTEIAKTITEQLKVQLSPEERAALANRRLPTWWPTGFIARLCSI